MPTSRDPDGVYDIAERLLDCALAAVTDTPSGAPGRACVVHGAVAWDDCECGQLTVAIAGISPSAQFPTLALAPGPSGPMQSRCGAPLLVIEYNVTMLRCMATTDDAGSAPPCDLLGSDAQIAARDAWAVRTGIVCCLQEMRTERDERGATYISEWTTGVQSMVGPAGRCGGSNLQVFVGIQNGCNCG